MSSHSRGHLPVACTLNAADATDQLSSWTALQPLCARAERTPGRAVLWFEQPAEHQLRAMAEREAACCQFLQLSIRHDGHLVRLEISSRSAGTEAVIELLAAQASGR
jgi:hypothetical protein